MAGGYPGRWCWDIVIDSSNNAFQVDEGGGAFDVDLLTTPVGGLFWRGDGTVNDFCAYLDLRLSAESLAHGAARSYTVSISTAGILTITCNGASTILFGTGVHDHDPLLWGWTDADHALPYTGTMQVQKGWWPESMTVEDSEEFPVSDSVTTILENGRHRSANYGYRTVRDLLVDCLPANKIFQAEESRTHESFQRLYTSCISPGGRVEYTPNTAVPATHSQYVYRDPKWPVELTPRTIRRYNVSHALAAYVA